MEINHIHELIARRYNIRATFTPTGTYRRIEGSDLVRREYIATLHCEDRSTDFIYWYHRTPTVGGFLEDLWYNGRGVMTCDEVEFAHEWNYLDGVGDGTYADDAEAIAAGIADHKEYTTRLKKFLLLTGVNFRALADLLEVEL